MLLHQWSWLNKEKDPNKQIINGIHNIKGRTYVNILISNHLSKNITFTKGEHAGHLEPPIEDIQQVPEDSESKTAHSITMKRMMAEEVPDTFEPPHHKFRTDIKIKLEELLKEYQSQFRKKMRQPVSQKSYPIVIIHYAWVKDKINKLLTAKVIWGSWSSWSAAIIVVPKVMEENV